ncbi:MAG: porin [Thalassospira sp.]|uniref:porin n=1 Tax=Thalassospira sp. TaxID=1912094 RepID=UPI0032EFD548
MKKILFATSALVAVAAAGSVQASEKIQLEVGGYMEQWAGVADQDVGESKNAFQSDAEVHFSGKTTLDNGIEVGAKIELEAETSTDQIDEQYLFVNGGFGQVKLGKDDSAADSLAITAPSVGPVGVNDGDLTNWVDAYLIDTVPSSGDQNRVTYFTPNLGGFQAGVSYADDNQRNGSGGYNGTDGTGDNIVSAGVSYQGDFDGVSFGVSATGENQGEGNWYGVGATVGFGNFVVGSSWGHIEDDYAQGENSRTAGDTDAYDVGVSYAMDAAKVSLSYAYAEYGNRQVGSTTATSTGEMSTVDLGLAYTLGAGVTWKSSVFWFDDEADSAAISDNDGFGAVTGLVLAF